MGKYFVTLFLCVLMQAVSLGLFYPDLRTGWSQNVQFALSLFLLVWPPFFVLTAFSEDRWKKWRHFLLAAALAGVFAGPLVGFFGFMLFVLMVFGALGLLLIYSLIYFFYALKLTRSDEAIRTHLRSAVTLCAFLFLEGLTAAALFYFGAETSFGGSFLKFLFGGACSGPCGWGYLLGVFQYLCFGTVHYFIALAVLVLVVLIRKNFRPEPSEISS